MHEVLKSNPDIINRIADWKSILKTLGVQMTDAEVDSVIEQARARATDLLSAELDKASDLIGDKVRGQFKKDKSMLKFLPWKLT